jgi:hypothetical protein
MGDGDSATASVGWMEGIKTGVEVLVVFFSFIFFHPYLRYIGFGRGIALLYSYKKRLP